MCQFSYKRVNEKHNEKCDGINSMNVQCILSGDHCIQIPKAPGAGTPTSSGAVTFCDQLFCILLSH